LVFFGYFLVFALIYLPALNVSAPNPLIVKPPYSFLKPAPLYIKARSHLSVAEGSKVSFSTRFKMLSEAYQLVATLQLGSNCCSFIVIFAALSSAPQKCERALKQQKHQKKNIVHV